MSTKPSFLTSPIKAFKAMVKPKPVAAVLNESDLMILRNLMKNTIECSQFIISMDKRDKAKFWAESDVTRKSDPKVASSYKYYKQISNNLRKEKARYKRLVDIQKKLRTMLKVN